MCDECKVDKQESYNNTYLIYSKHKVTGLYHCLTNAARQWYNKDNEKISDSWWVAGVHVVVSTQEQFEKSVEYREWKLKAFK